MWWTEDRIRWYERASAKCSFHTDLARIIENHLVPEESILELGCGLGHVSAILNKTHPIRSVDIEENAVMEAERREGIRIYSVSDWKDLREKADCLLCIFFGHLEKLDELESQMKLANRHALFIYSEHRGQKEDLILKKTAAREKTEEKLKELGYRVKSESLSLPFPQPLLSLEEAEAFITLSYPKKNVSDYIPFVAASGEDNYPYTLKNEKRMVLFDIAK